MGRMSYEEVLLQEGARKGFLLKLMLWVRMPAL
jgi:hypothetical protein